jgi:hypothetical protein
MKNEIWMLLKIYKIGWKTCTYLDGDKNSYDAHHHILRKNTGDVSVLVIVHIEQTVAEYDRGGALRG